VVLFVVASLFVAAIVIGVIFFVSERGEQVRRDKAQEVAVQQLRDQEAAQEESSSEEPAPAPVIDGVSQEQAGTRSEPADSAPRPSTEALPATGPVGDALGAVLVFGLVSLSIAYYVTSRRAVSASRL